MADCFSLPNAAEMVEQLRFLKKYMRHTEINELYLDEVMAQAADAIERLIADNAKLKAELNAAMKELPHDCNSCSKDCDITIAHKALLTKRCDKWEWRGVKETDDNERT